MHAGDAGQNHTHRRARYRRCKGGQVLTTRAGYRSHYRPMEANYSSHNDQWCRSACTTRRGVLVFKPTSGLCNSLIAAASVAALAVASCREFALDWDKGTNAAAGASFLSMFEQIPGVSATYWRGSDSTAMRPRLGCKLDLTQWQDVEDPKRPTRRAVEIVTTTQCSVPL